MTFKTYAIAVMATFLITPVQALAQSAAAAAEPRFEVALVAARATDVGARRAYHFRQSYDRDVHYRRHYRATLPYDGYRPYALPVYDCPYFGSPIPLYPYCWGRYPG